MPHLFIRLMMVASLLLVACAPAAAPSPTAAPAKPAAPAPAPAASPAPAAAPAPAASPAAAPAAPAAAASPAPAAAAPAASPAAAPAAPKPAASPAAAPAAPPRKVANSSYKDGDTVNLIVATSAGGGYDTQARLLQPFLEKAFKQVTDANVRVVVQNMPGAQQRVALEFTNRAAPDGKTIVYTSGKIAAGHQVLSGASFDVEKMTSVGSLGSAGQAIAVAKSLQLPERTFLGLAKRSEQKPILIGHTGVEPDLKLSTVLLRDKGLTLKWDMVGIDGTSPLMAALLRGDVEAAITTTAGMTKFIEDNADKLELLVNASCDRDPAAPSIPTIVEQRVPAAQEICSTLGGGGRQIIGPPGIAGATNEALVEALRVAILDPEHVAAQNKIDFVISYGAPTDVAKQLQENVKLYNQYKSELQ